MPDDTARYDVVVCGGGPAGIAAALFAASMKRRTLLVERYGRLGGMAVSGLVQPIMGSVESAFVQTLIERLGGRRVDFEQFDLHAAREITAAGGDILLHSLITGACVQDGCVKSASVAGKSGSVKIEGDVFVDATGDGDVAFAVGAEFELGREGDGLTQPVSIMFRVSGVDEERGLYCGSEEEAHAKKVGSRTWHEIVMDGLAKGALPETVGIIRAYGACRPGDRVINATQVNYVNGLDERELTRAELEGREQACRVMDFLQEHAPGYENAYISGMPAVVGVRETRRFAGVKRMERDDVIAGRRCEDAVVKGACFPIDIHNPDGTGQAEGFAAKTVPYDIPYGCLVPERMDGLLLSGRCISGSHAAHASYRVMAIAMATGAAAGAAAALASREGIQPRDVAASEVQRVLFQCSG